MSKNKIIRKLKKKKCGREEKKKMIMIEFVRKLFKVELSVIECSC